MNINLTGMFTWMKWIGVKVNKSNAHVWPSDDVGINTMPLLLPICIAGTLNTGSIPSKIRLAIVAIYTNIYPEIRSPPPIGYDGYRRRWSWMRRCSCSGSVTSFEYTLSLPFTFLLISINILLSVIHSYKHQPRLHFLWMKIYILLHKYHSASSFLISLMLTIIVSVTVRFGTPSIFYLKHVSKHTHSDSLHCSFGLESS